MEKPRSDPIAAIATASGRGGIGVVRVSGSDLGGIVEGVIGRHLRPRHATHCQFRNARGEVLDDGIALYFPAPRSYTGEEILELQGHGGYQVLHMVLERCLELGARPAEPGEFTRRAFLNDKIDLAQAEAVADLIDAQSREAVRSALRTLKGDFSLRVHDLVDKLIQLRTLVEATLDFPDEEIDFLEQADALGRLQTVRDDLEAVFAEARQGALLREGLSVVLIGQPNVGKSSLLNRLAGYDAAIVTDVAGTTRDTVRESIQIRGVPLHVVDTAGLREPNDPVESIGIGRTWAAVEKADMALLLVDAVHGMGEAERTILGRLPNMPRITVHNKIDLTGEEPRRSGQGQEIWLSARTGAGMDLLRELLLEQAGWQASGEGSYMARTRHLDALRVAQRHLDQARDAYTRPELMAEELRLAQEALSGITGEFTSDDLLGMIFSRFCIGK